MFRFCRSPSGVLKKKVFVKFDMKRTDFSAGCVQCLTAPFMRMGRMAEQTIQQLKRMQQQVKWVVSNGCDSSDDGESSDSADSMLGEEESEPEEEGNSSDPLVTAPTRALQRRQHEDHDYIPPCLQNLFDTCRESTQLDLACHLNEVLHNCIVPVRHHVKVPTKLSLSVGELLCVLFAFGLCYVLTAS